MIVRDFYTLECSFTFLFLFGFNVVWSQVGVNDNKPLQVDSKTSNDTLHIEEIDTLSNEIYSFSLYDLFALKSWRDSSLQWFHEYEQTRNRDELYIHTGNLGSSAFSLFYRPTFKSGFELGHRQHNVYKKSKESIRFYNLEKPFSQVYFSPAGSQSSFTSSAVVGRDFNNNVKLSLDFRRINAESVYLNQDTRHTYLHLGIYQEIPKTRWGYAVHFLSNSNYESYNGGISDTSQLAFSFRGVRTNIPVYLSDTYSYSLSRKYIANLFYHLKKENHLKRYISLELERSNDLYKAIDKTIRSNDTLKFGIEYIPSDLGVRLHNSIHSNKIRVGYHIDRSFMKSFIYSNYTLHSLVTDIDINLISDFILGTRTQLNWKNWILEADGFIGRSNGSNILDIHPNIQYTKNSWMDIELGFRFHVRPPDYHENQMLITNREVYNNQWKSSTIQMLYGNIGIPKIGLNARLKSVASQNALYFNGETNQFDILDQVNYIHLSLAERYSYKWLELYTSVAMQFQNVEIYGTPNWYSRHGIAFAYHLFDKKMLVHAGVTLDYIPAHSLPKYHVLVSRLYGKGNSVGNQYRSDAHVNFKVQGFRFFVKYENLAFLWSKNVNYQISEYPQLDGRLRLGVSWQLRN